MDRTGWIVIIACSLGLFLWFDGQKKKIEEQRKVAEQNQETSQAVNPDGASPEKAKKDTPACLSSIDSVKKLAPTMKKKVIAK